MTMTDEEFGEWLAEFEETLLCEYSKDIADTGLTTEQLRKMTHQPAYLAAIEYAASSEITQKGF